MTGGAAEKAGASILIVDSSSCDATPELARAAGFCVRHITREEFDHGRTRNEALKQLSDCEFVVFLTQDALVESVDTISTLIQSFDNPNIGAVYGRQLPHPEATPIAAHARLFNYPPYSHQVASEQIASMGIKAAFLSNSFTAYRRSALIEVGGFPDHTILGEDMIAGASLLNAGWHIAYCAQARVFHSHNYSMIQEFRRYFDIGVMHSHEEWILSMTGNAEGEGRRFVISEMRYLWQHRKSAIPEAILRTGFKYLGYRLGRLEKYLPLSLKRQLSMHTNHWRS